jgi:hypothetical protein
MAALSGLRRDSRYSIQPLPQHFCEGCCTCCEKAWLMVVASWLSCCTPLIESLSSATASGAVSATYYASDADE